VESHKALSLVLWANRFAPMIVGKLNCPQWLRQRWSAKILDDLSCLSPLWVVKKMN
jgi:hypothetical protein